MDRDRPEMYEALGRTIQVLRTDQGIDRKELAERAGISYSYLAAIENGVKPPSSKVLFVIAEALGLRSHELLGAAETRRERGAPPVPSRSWFHADAGPPPAALRSRSVQAGRSERRSSPAPARADAFEAESAAGFAPPPEAPSERSDLPMNRTVPRSPTGYLMELERLTRLLDDADRELVLDLARRLAGRHR